MKFKEIFIVLFLTFLALFFLSLDYYFVWAIFDKINRPMFKNLDWASYFFIGFALIPITILIMQILIVQLIKLLKKT